MKVNLLQKITDLEGKVLMDNEHEVTLKSLITGALGATLEEDRNAGTIRVAERWALMMQVHTANEIDFTPEQVAMIRERIVRCYKLIAAGRALDMLR